jgi:hypothetical protein
MIPRLLILSGLLFTGPALARPYSTSYLSFELPATWDCELEQTEFVCSETGQTTNRRSIIIFTAKEQGSEDSLDQYFDHLSAPMTLRDSTGKVLGTSTPELPKRVTVNGIEWVVGQHVGSEISNYSTRYYATVHDGIAVLVTFSAHASASDEAFRQFDPSFRTLRIRNPFSSR